MIRFLAALIAAAVALGPPARAVDYTWVNPAGGSWATATNWSAVGVPGANDNAVIATAGAYTVAVPTGQAVNNLTLNNAAATVNVAFGASGFALGGTMTLTAGTWTLGGLQGSPAGLSGGTVTGTNGRLRIVGDARFTDTQVYGNVLSFDAPSSPRLRLAGSANFAPGSTVTFGPPQGGSAYPTSSGVTVENNQTINNVTVNLGINTTLGALGGTNLNIGLNAVVQYTDPSFNNGPSVVGREFYDGTGGLVSLVNRGTIRAYNGGELYVGRYFDVGGSNPNLTVSNFGLIHAEAAAVTIHGYHGNVGEGLAGVRNEPGGVIRASGGGIVSLFAFDWVNQGTFDVTGAGSTLQLGGRFTRAAIGAVTRTAGTEVGFSLARMDNAGGTFALNAATGNYILWASSLDGSAEIGGGAVSATDGARLEIRVLPGAVTGSDYNYLTGVAVGRDVLAFTGDYGKLIVRGGTTFAAGDTINLAANSSELAFAQTGTVDGVTFVLSAPSALVGLSNRLTVHDDNTLTLGPATTVRKIGGGRAGLAAERFYLPESNPTIVNRGLIDVQGGVLELRTSNGTFTNRGTVRIGGGATLEGSFTSTAGGTVTGTGAVTGNLLIDVGGRVRGGDMAGQLTVTGGVAVTAGGTTAAPGNIATQAVRTGPGTATNGRVAVLGAGNGFDLVALGGSRFVQLEVLGPTLVAGESYDLLLATAAGGIHRNGSAVGANYTFAAADYRLSSPDFAAFTGVSLFTTDANTLVLRFTPTTPVPEPSLLLVPAAAVLYFRRRRA